MAIRSYNPVTDQAHDILGLPAGNDLDFPLSLLQYPLHGLVTFVVFWGFIGLGYFLWGLSKEDAKKEVYELPSQPFQGQD